MSAVAEVSQRITEAQRRLDEHREPVKRYMQRLALLACRRLDRRFAGHHLPKRLRKEVRWVGLV